MCFRCCRAESTTEPDKRSGPSPSPARPPSSRHSREVDIEAMGNNPNESNVPLLNNGENKRNDCNEMENIGNDQDSRRVSVAENQQNESVASNDAGNSTGVSEVNSPTSATHTDQSGSVGNPGGDSEYHAADTLLANDERRYPTAPPAEDDEHNNNARPRGGAHAQMSPSKQTFVSVLYM